MSNTVDFWDSTLAQWVALRRVPLFVQDLVCAELLAILAMSTLRFLRIFSNFNKNNASRWIS